MRRLTGGRAWLPSARGRLVGVMTLVVALALGSSVIIVAQVLLSRAESRMAQELTHEGEKLRRFAAAALDPATGAPFTDVEALLSGYLRGNVPDGDETFFSVVDGRASQRSPHTPPARLDLDAEVVAYAAAATAPAWRSVASEVGEARVAVFPLAVAGDPRPAALVVIQFAQGPRGETWEAVRILGIVGLIALAAASLVSWFVAGRILEPVRLVRRTAQRLTESDLSQRIAVTGNDDVAALATTFNAMLDRLQTAFDGQRQFLHDAGHELRTPLTVIRGQLELMGSDPDEQRETLALVRDEIDRMDRLVGDLSALASAARPDFLRWGRVDLAELVIDVVAKAKPLGDRRWGVDQLVERQVVGDQQRLTQALMQLIANAVAHTGDGDEIAVGAELAGGRTRLWVRDSGVGIPDADATRIFERFARGASAGRRGGTGLGLAIVESIARAHGGTARVDSTPGEGATFTLELPLSVVQEAEE